LSNGGGRGEVRQTPLGCTLAGVWPEFDDDDDDDDDDHHHHHHHYQHHLHHHHHEFDKAKRTTTLGGRGGARGGRQVRAQTPNRRPQKLALVLEMVRVLVLVLDT
jgi:hypothetical protein